MNAAAVMFSALCITALSHNPCRALNVTETAQALKSLKEFFFSDCVFLVTSRVEEDADVVATARYLSDGVVPTASLGVATLAQRHKTMVETCNRPMVAGLSDSGMLRAHMARLSTTSSISGTTWLLFLKLADPLDAILRGVDIPFDCEFLIARPMAVGVFLLTEVYRVSTNGSLRATHFGSWTLRGGLRAPEVGLYTRRNSLDGHVLVTANEHDPPISVLQPGGNQTVLGGFSGAVWKIFERRMNFSTRFTVSDGVGSPLDANTNASWDGMIGKVLRGEVDLTSSAITMTPDTSEVVAFMFPLYTIYSRVFVRLQDSREVYWDNFLAPFSPSLWLAFLGTSLGTAVLLTGLYRVVRQSYDTDEEPYTLYDAVFLIFGAIFCQQGHERTPRSLPCRIVHILTYVTAVIAINSYSGSIISNLTVYRPQLPFPNLRGLYDDGGYAVGILRHSFVYGMFKNGKQPYVRELYAKYIAVDPRNTPKDNVEGFRRVCQEKFGFVSTAEAESVLREELNCTVVYLPEHFVKFSASLAFPRNSPYRGLFNHNLLKLVNSGVISNLYKSSVQKQIMSTMIELESIDLKDVTPILSIMAGGIMLGLTFLASEKLLSVILLKKAAMKIPTQDLFTEKEPVNPFGMRPRLLRQRYRGNMPGLKRE